MLKCSNFAKFLDLESGYRYLNTISCKKRKKYWFLTFLFMYIYHFIDLNASLSYIMSIVGEKLF